MKNIAVILLILGIYHFPNLSTNSNTHKNDSLNNHFVRFLCFSVPNESNANFSVSLEKLSLPNTETEPLVDVMNNYETNIVVNRAVYLKFKEYILCAKNNLNQDLEQIRHNNYILEINVDSDHKYYLDDRQSISFINGFKQYLAKNELSGSYNKFLSLIESKAEYSIKYPKTNSKDPN